MFWSNSNNLDNVPVPHRCMIPIFVLLWECTTKTYQFQIQFEKKNLTSPVLPDSLRHKCKCKSFLCEIIPLSHCRRAPTYRWLDFRPKGVSIRFTGKNKLLLPRSCLKNAVGVGILCKTIIMLWVTSE